MKLKSIRLKDFKRFDDLTINLGEEPKKIIALVGPNGCGKSSIFDAFAEILNQHKSGGAREQPSYYSKSWHSKGNTREHYASNESIFLTDSSDSNIFNIKSFYIRSAYRFTPKLKVDTIKSQPAILTDSNRPASSIQLDTRMTQNYEQLSSHLIAEFYIGKKTGDEVRNRYIERINIILKEILDIRVSSLGNISAGKGQLFFEKENAINFPYDNLSSGEKGVIDIIIDLIIKSDEFNDTVYCIDEPELHLNTAIQRKLLTEVEKLIPNNCQLWIATHSIGFLRALQEELKDKTSVLDFSEKDYFNDTKEIEPISPTRENWQRIFRTALDDLTGLIAPKRIVYCEGKLENSLDEAIFNIIFMKEYPDTMFVSSGNKSDVQRYSAIALGVLNKAFSGVEIIALIDKDDDLVPVKKGTIAIKKLQRREFENYLFDKEVLNKYCDNTERSFNADLYDRHIQNINDDDVKKMKKQIKDACGYVGNDKEFKHGLAEALPQTPIYDMLKNEIGLP